MDKISINSNLSIDPLSVFNPEGSSYTHNHKAHRLYRAQRLDECLEFIEKTMKRSPQSSCEFLLFLKAMILRNSGELSKALEIFQQVSYLAPQNVDNLKQMAQTFFLLGETEKCLALCNDIDTIQSQSSAPTPSNALPNSPELTSVCRDVDLEMLRAQCLLAQNDPKRATEKLHAASLTRPTTASTLALARTQQEQGDETGAVNTLSRGLAMHSNHPELLAALARMHIGTGNTTTVRSCLCSLVHSCINSPYSHHFHVTIL
jgi:predicted Zn-dependent protease